MSEKRPRLKVAWVAVGAAVVWGISLAEKLRDFDLMVSDGGRVQAVVIADEAGPLVRFETPQGAIVRARLREPLSAFRPDPLDGARVDVVYDRSNPARFATASTGTLLYILLALDVGLFLVGIVGLASTRKGAR